MKLLPLFFLTFLTCTAQVPTQFSEEALNDSFLTLEGDSIPFKDILKDLEGNDVVIDIWATWCKDCISGMPKLKELQKEYPKAKFLFLSLDKDTDKWKRGIEVYDLKGEHFYMQTGWKGPFGNFLDLDWVPRYLVLDKKGTIKLFKAIKADDKEIKNALK